ncbi:MAG: hypothetical protein KDA32_04190 [Phycisphaerales bacterium]|nr:hypothetical protein [Phycisphaerales bacterium]
MRLWRWGMATALVCALVSPSLAQLRVVTWNISNYSGGNASNVETAVYGVFEGRSMSPDVFICQEFLSASASNSFLSILNAAPGSPGDWAAAPFINGPDTDSAFFYRTSRVLFKGVTVVATGGTSPNHPRNIQRYDIQPIGYFVPECFDPNNPTDMNCPVTGGGKATIACYSVHMKAGSTGDDQARRLLEAQRIRDDAEALPANWMFLIAGDYNIQSSTQSAYQELTGSQANNAGRFFDPINTPGGWNNNGAFRFVHTQDPIGAGGMDDRHDQILLSGNLVDGAEFDYIGNASVPYSTTTWNDTNHSYRSYGNDGTSYNTTLTTTGNTMVGPTIALSLQAMASGAGHLPVFLDIRLPAKVSSVEVLDFGTVVLGGFAEQPLDIAHGGAVARWGVNGLEDLTYSLSHSQGLLDPNVEYTLSAGDAPNTHMIEVLTDTVGLINETVTIHSNAPEDPDRVVLLVGEVVAPSICLGDLDNDNMITLSDLSGFLGAFGACVGDAAYVAAADFDSNNCIELADLSGFLGVFGSVCP